jgi:hypothetical protein
MQTTETHANWLNYISILGALGILGFFNPYFSSLGALSVFYLGNSEDVRLRRLSLVGYLGFLGPILLVLSKIIR